MKSLFLVLAVCFSPIVFAQDDMEAHFFERYMHHVQYRPFKYSPVGKVKQITFVKRKKGKDIAGTFVKKYNASGEMFLFRELDKKNEVKKEIQVTYDDKGHVKDAGEKRHGKQHRLTSFTRNGDDRMTRVQTENAKGKIIDKQTWTYNEEGCLAENISYRKGGEKVLLKWTHTYYPECKLSKTVMTNGRGKVKRTWTYDCKKEGEVLQKKKDEVQVCRWEESSSDTLIKVSQSLDERGKTYKSVMKFTVGDTLILESRNYDKKDKLYQKVTYDKSFDKILTYQRLKGRREKYGFIYTYKGDLLTSMERTLKGQLKNKVVYEYDVDHLLTSLKYLNKKGDVLKDYSMAYEL